MSKKEVFFVSLIIVLGVVLNNLNFMYGLRATPKGSVFLGTVHWSGDYFYYLSQFTQGRDRWFFGYDLFTGDFKQLTLVGWVNVFLGHLFWLVGVGPHAAYQASVSIFTITFLVSVYLLLREIYKKDKTGWKSITALVLLLVSNPLPVGTSYYDFWYNNGTTFARILSVPHHMIARTLICLSLWISMKWMSGVKKHVKWIVSCLLIGFVLASVEPVHWAVTVATIVVGVGAWNIVGHLSNLGDLGHLGKRILYGWIPAFGIFVGGFPMALYLKTLFASVPYSQLASWEMSQTVHLPAWQIISGNGVISVFAIVGIIFFARSLRSPKELGYPLVLMVMFAIICLGTFFSPLPQWGNIVNVRFLPAVLTLCFAVLGIEGLERIGGVVNTRHGKGYISRSIVILGVLVMIGSSLPALQMQIQARTKTDPSNGFFYITQPAYNAYKMAESISTAQDTFLVMWPYNWSFPAVTGRRVMWGHPLLTIDNDKKDPESFRFIDRKMSIEESKTYLQRNGIKFLMLYSWAPKLDDMSFVKKVSDNGFLAIYHVEL